MSAAVVCQLPDRTLAILNKYDNNNQQLTKWLEYSRLHDPLVRCQRRFHERPQVCLRQPNDTQPCSPSLPGLPGTFAEAVYLEP